MRQNQTAPWKVRVIATTTYITLAVCLVLGIYSTAGWFTELPLILAAVIGCLLGGIVWMIVMLILIVVFSCAVVLLQVIGQKLGWVKKPPKTVADIRREESYGPGD